MIERLILMRHGESDSNIQRRLRQGSTAYQEFIQAHTENPYSDITRTLAQRVLLEFPPSINQSFLTGEGIRQTRETCSRLKSLIPAPDVTILSPYRRTQQTWEIIRTNWPDLAKTLTIIDPRIREHDWGSARKFGTDHKLFTTLNPDWIQTQQGQNPFFSRYPEGESLADVEKRETEWLDDLQRDFPRQTVMVIGHSMAILVVRKILEGFTPEYLLEISAANSPINAGITLYEKSSQHKLDLKTYNLRLY